jgi:hypothetical protein
MNITSWVLVKILSKFRRTHYHCLQGRKLRHAKWNRGSIFLLLGTNCYQTTRCYTPHHFEDLNIIKLNGLLNLQYIARSTYVLTENQSRILNSVMSPSSMSSSSRIICISLDYQNPKDGSNTPVRNVGNYLSIDTATHPRRLGCKSTPL